MNNELKNHWKNPVFTSLGVHLLVIIALTILHYTDFEDKNTKMTKSLLESSVRIDVVSMPKMTLKELKELESQNTAIKEKSQESEIKKVVKEIQEEEKEELEKSEGSFLNKLKDISKKKLKKTKVVKKRTSKKAKKNINNEMKQELKKLVYEGNKLSKGTSVEGKKGSEDLGAYEEYSLMIPQKVKNYWTLPGYLIDKGYNCQIKIYINDRGELINSEIIESSGNDDFDRHALEAIKSASPFSIPPREIVKILKSGSLVLSFPF